MLGALVVVRRARKSLPLRNPRPRRVATRPPSSGRSRRHSSTAASRAAPRTTRHGRVRDARPDARSRPSARSSAINLIYQGVNLAFKPEDEKIYYRTYPKIWWNNISYGFEWDDNTFMINQWGHPYQGSTYFSAGRANGLSFWESAPLAALGALTWEYLAERHKPSLNDLIMTTLGGISLGEMFHRTAWLIRDTSDTGKSRMTREIVAAVFDPITGINRFIDRDALKVVEKPAMYVPSALLAAFDVGVLWRGENLSFLEADGEPFLQANLGYGTLSQGRSKAPFDAFVVSLRMGGGGGAISEASRARAAAWGAVGRTGRDAPTRHTLHFMTRDGLRLRQQLRVPVRRAGHLGRVHRRVALHPGVAARDELPAGVPRARRHRLRSTSRSRPTLRLRARAQLRRGLALTRRGHPFVRASYSGVWLHTVDGAQADHWTQNVRLDLLVPVKGRRRGRNDGGVHPPQVLLRRGRRRAAAVSAGAGVPLVDVLTMRTGLRGAAVVAHRRGRGARSAARPTAQQAARCDRATSSWASAGGYAATKSDCSNCGSGEDGARGEDGATYDDVGFVSRSRRCGG